MTKTYFSIGTATVAEVKAALEEHSVPDDAVFDYVGCGTHRYEVRDAEEYDDVLAGGVTVPPTFNPDIQHPEGTRLEHGDPFGETPGVEW